MGLALGLILAFYLKNFYQNRLKTSFHDFQDKNSRPKAEGGWSEISILARSLKFVKNEGIPEISSLYTLCPSHSSMGL